MRVLGQDRNQGLIKLRADRLDDLWHLTHLVEEGDLVRGVTHRRLDDRQDMVRDTGGERVTMTMGIRVEEMEFHEPSQQMRILGKIEEAPETIAKGDHHTIAVGENDWVEILKPDGWSKHLLDRVQEAVEATEEPLVVIVSMDETEGSVAVLYQFGVREIGTARRTGGGKQYKSEDASGAYYAELRQILETTAPEGCPVVVVGPGFAREHFVSHLDKHPVETLTRVATEAVGQPGMPGVNEALRRGIVTRVAEGSRLARESEAVEDLFKRLGQDRPATYGPAEVEKALQYGAVETLLVVDEKVKEGAVDELLDLAAQTGAEVITVGAGHDAGEKLKALTGIAALLRFQVET